MGQFKENKLKEKEYREHFKFLRHIKNGSEPDLVELLSKYGYSYIGELLERYNANDLTDAQYLATLTFYRSVKESDVREVEIYKWQKPLIENNLFGRAKKTVLQEMVIKDIKGKYQEGEINNVISELELYGLMILLEDLYLFSGQDQGLVAKQILEMVTEDDLLDLPESLLYREEARRHKFIKKVVKSLKAEEYDESLDCGAMKGFESFEKIWENYQHRIDAITKMSWIATLRKRMNILVEKVKTGVITPDELKRKLPTQNNIRNNYNVKELQVLKSAFVKMIEASKEHISAFIDLISINDKYGDLNIVPGVELTPKGIINLVEYRDAENEKPTMLKTMLRQLIEHPEKFDVVAEHFNVKGKVLNHYLYLMGRFDLENGDQESVDYILRKHYFSRSEDMSDSVMIKVFFENEKYKEIIEKGNSTVSKERKKLMELLFKQAIKLDEPNQYWEIYLEMLMNCSDWLNTIFGQLEYAKELPEYIKSVIKLLVEKYQSTYEGGYGYRSERAIKNWGNPLIEKQREAKKKLEQFFNEVGKPSQDLSGDYNKTATIISNKDKVDNVEEYIQPNSFYSIHSYGSLAIKLNNETMINTYKEIFKGTEGK